jgi:hypothetical protein
MRTPRIRLAPSHLEAVYKVNRAVAGPKQAIRVRAGDDPELSQRIGRLEAEERRTLDRRFGRLAGAAWQRREGEMQPHSKATQWYSVEPPDRATDAAGHDERSLIDDELVVVEERHARAVIVSNARYPAQIGPTRRRFKRGQCQKNN